MCRWSDFARLYWNWFGASLEIEARIHATTCWLCFVLAGFVPWPVSLRPPTQGESKTTVTSVCHHLCMHDKAKHKLLASRLLVTWQFITLHSIPFGPKNYQTRYQCCEGYDAERAYPNSASNFQYQCVKNWLYRVHFQTCTVCTSLLYWVHFPNLYFKKLLIFLPCIHRPQYELASWNKCFCSYLYVIFYSLITDVFVVHKQ